MNKFPFETVWLNISIFKVYVSVSKTVGHIE